MLIAAACAVLPLLQSPQETYDTFVWPPTAATKLHYRCKLQKSRVLSAELQQAERAERKALGLPTPARPPRQAVTLEMDLTLEPQEQQVQAGYTTRLGRPADLRWKLQTAPTDGAPPPQPLRNDRRHEVWGLADDGRAPVLEVPRSALEQTFTVQYPRQARGVGRADLGPHFGDHLLPVLWEQPLPCWLSHGLDVVELHGQAAIEGKSLIRDGSGSFPLGHRETRVKLQFTKAAAGSFAFTYTMQVRQRVSGQRPFEWVFDVEGEAEYAVPQQAFTRIRETVQARPDKLAEGHAARILDEAFHGSIEIDPVTPPVPGKPRRGR